MEGCFKMGTKFEIIESSNDGNIVPQGVTIIYNSESINDDNIKEQEN